MTRQHPTTAELAEQALCQARLQDLLRQGWPVRAISAASGVPAGTVARLASGQCRRVHPRHADQIGNVFAALNGWRPRGCAPKPVLPNPLRNVLDRLSEIRVAARYGEDLSAIAARYGTTEQLVRLATGAPLETAP